MTAPDLTAAELENLRVMAQPVKLAAHNLGVHPSTIKLHRRAIAQKLGAANYASACVIAAMTGLRIDPQTRRPAMTYLELTFEIERKKNKRLKKLLAEAIQWNWLDLEEMERTEEGREEARACLPYMLKVREEIFEALK